MCILCVFMIMAKGWVLCYCHENSTFCPLLSLFVSMNTIQGVGVMAVNQEQGGDEYHLDPRRVASLVQTGRAAASSSVRTAKCHYP